MAAIIQVSGTAEEIIEFARVLRAGQTASPLSLAEQLAADEGRIIDAIKLYRNRTGASLREAKDIVDAYARRDT